MSALHLQTLGVIAIGGEERLSFLQGQFTQNVERLSTEQGLLTGWCNAKGRLLAIGWLLAWRDQVLWLVPRWQVDDLIRRLRMFVLRAKVTLESPGVTVRGIIEDGAAAATSSVGPLSPAADVEIRLPAAADEPSRKISVAFTAVPEDGKYALSTIDWARLDIAAGMPAIAPETLEQFVPQMVNLDLIDGISFNKGCYVGQEVAARTQNLGRIKRRMFRFRTSGPVQAGEPLSNAAGEKIGVVVSTASGTDSSELLAVVQLAAARAPVFLQTQDSALDMLPLPYSIPEYSASD